MDTKMVATMLGTLGVLFLFTASYTILPSNIGQFLAMVCFIISGAFWSGAFAGVAWFRKSDK